MKRRDFIKLIGGAAAAWPLGARAQQQTVVGFLNGISFGGPSAAQQATAIRQGLRESGYVEGRNLTIEYRSANGQYERLPSLAADLVSRQVALIIAVGSTKSPQAAREATSTIPIVFAVGSDPVDTGLVTNLRRPEANLTGVTFGMAGLMEAARTLGLQISVFGASTDREFLSAFQSMEQQHIAALILSSDASLGARRDLIAALAAQHAIPTIHTSRVGALAGGLISYGAEVNSLNRQAGLYAGRILKGEKPPDLPVVLPTKFEEVINLRTAKELGLIVPLQMLIVADEVIE